MACDYPIVCQYWDAWQKAATGIGCTYPDALFISGKFPHPCEQHQLRIDHAEMEELRKENLRLKAEIRGY